MAGRTPAEAVNAFLEPLQQSLSCVTDVPVHVSGGYHEAEKPHAVTLGSGDPVPIGGPLELQLRFRHQYRIVEAKGERGPYKVTTVQYAYGLESRGGEVLAYHWHPTGVSSETDPHLHLGPAAGVGLDLLRDAHVPTGRVSIEDVLLFGVAELRAETRRGDWQSVLEATKRIHEEWRTWPAPRHPA